MEAVAKVQAGQGRIVARRVGSHATIEQLAASYPLKLLSPRSRLPNVSAVYMLTYGGGLVAGDQVHLRADVFDGVNLVLLTQVSVRTTIQLTPL